MKVLRAGSKEAASCPAIISVAGATVDLPPEQWKLLDEDKHPLTARLFDFVTGDLFDKKRSNASMLILLHPDHLSLDGDETWNTRFVRVAIPTGGAEHVTAADAIVDAGPSGEVAGKSPVTGPHDHASLSSLPSHKLAVKILQLECRLAAQAEENARLKKRQESGVGGVAVVGSEELASALANAVWVLEKEARAIAQERAALVDTRNQEALVLRRVDARLGQLQGVVADSMEAAQKKLMDEVAGSSTTCRPRGKGKAEDGEAPATAGSLASRRDVQSAAAAAAEGRQTTLAPARAVITTGNLHSALASAGPIAASVEVKAEKRGRGGKKLPPPPVYTIDEDKADTELEGLMSRWVEAGDGGEQGGEAAVDVNCAGESADEQDGDPVIVEGGTTGGHGDTGPNRRGCGIRAPPRGGPGLVSEPHIGGKKRWLGHADRQDLQYRTAIAMYPYDGKVDPELNLSQQQIREWAADLSIAEGLHMGLLITMHYRNLVASKDRWQRMFDSYRGLTKPGMHTTNVIAWAAVVGKDGAAEEADLGDVEPTDYARAIACAIAMVWEVTRSSNIIAAADNGNLAARAAGCYGERSRLFPVVSAYVINAVRECNRREH
ncbi:unnamed protein product [Closterium sp. NIES-65]|nr:unnamed protein product [Closterium sp. NIES-65]